MTIRACAGLLAVFLASAPPVAVASPAEATAGAAGPRPRPVATVGPCDGAEAPCPPAAADVCGIIERAAGANALDPHFFARLIWRESLFDPTAVSPKGAQGIAQFIPETAARRGLADPFDPVLALDASARYLADLTRAFGNLGLAAVAYNGGEARAERFRSRAGGLPLETRAYVHAITGHSAETWRDTPPPTLDVALAGGSFRDACLALAATRGGASLADAPPLLPWGVVLASGRDRDAADRQVARLRNRHAAVLGPETVAVARVRLPGVRRALHTAQVGRDTRAEADALCARLRGDGGDCMVLKN